MEAAGLEFGHGTENAWDEACWMLSAVLGIPPDFDDDELPPTLCRDRQARLEHLLWQRISSRKPLAYLLGEAWFAGLRFKVTEQVLVPRSPIAELIPDGFAPWLDPGALRRAADVGTGSGCLAVALAHYWPRVVVDATDISSGALEVARENAGRHGVLERVRLVRSDLMCELEGVYELILCNPPYVPAGDMAGLPPEHLHEPGLALSGGSDGLDLACRMFEEAAARLRPGGILVMEVGVSKPALEQRLPGVSFIWLEFAAGGEGVLLADHAACAEAARHVREK